MDIYMCICVCICELYVNVRGEIYCKIYINIYSFSSRLKFSVKNKQYKAKKL